MKDLSEFVPRQMGKNHVKGLSLALVDGDKVIWCQGFGKANERHNVPATADTLYPIGALSKIFTATETLKLIEKGKLGLDQSPQTALPGFSIHSRFKKAKALTIRSLLAQHSGLPGFHIRGMFGPNPESLEDLIGGLKDDYLAAPPQTFYRYSYLDYDLLGRIIEAKTKKDFSKAIDEEVFLPLGMESSYFQGETPKGQLAQGYGDGKESPGFKTQDVPATGMFSSAKDVAKFLQFLFAGKSGLALLTAKTRSLFFKEQYPGLAFDFGLKTGMGWLLNGIDIPGSEETAWMSGNYPGFYSRIVALDRQKLGLVLLTNSEAGQKLAADVTQRAMRLMLQAKYGIKADLSEPKKTTPPEVMIPGEQLDRYAGYYSALGQFTQIRREGGHLSTEVMKLGFDLVPIAQDTFIPRIVFLFLFPISIPQFPVQAQTVEGKDLAILRGLPIPIALEKIQPHEIPEAWKKRLGEYQVVNPDGQIEFKKVALTVENGFLCTSLKVSFPAFDFKDFQFKTPLNPVSDDDAAVEGLFYGDGATLHAESQDGVDKISYSGYEFIKKLETKP
ncbi:MAG TPA: serine hydrolase domain-containing protein [bacterium]|nr:serine hydrolase domain-containing protein [bacterium]